jgi:hypothetical protein
VHPRIVVLPWSVTGQAEDVTILDLAGGAVLGVEGHGVLDVGGDQGASGGCHERGQPFGNGDVEPDRCRGALAHDYMVVD